MAQKETDPAALDDAAQQRKGRMIFLLLAIFFIVPLLVVIAMIKLDWRPVGKSYGQLIHPPVSIASTTHWESDRHEAMPAFWQDKWNIVLIARECDASCMQRLYDLRQIYVSLYKDMIRVQRVLITQQADTRPIRERYPDLLIINGEATQIADLGRLLSGGGQNTLDAQRVYFIDPLGNIMMQYSLEQEAKWIRKDLMKLLKASWAG
ncbi:hypothetical protein SAMN05192566_1812 [Methylophilus rhizosphaerae]|uniref:Cytochrome oxidase Cu insertion factor, SCO1/SenC/PrrC family n=1 Tax=Methylophilus rhizosphaerae TaxID=492660 RepID=A0A1G9D6J8_9PROT|nr:hypothetical protein [Methylophilus rhizosphaerae]SDK59507.1 hypothetical protein SAMN05192566_1812 [Methylophilus rhizosphaerae]